MAGTELTKNTVNKWRAGTFFHHMVQAAKERGESLGDTIEWALNLGYCAAEVDADDLSGTEFLEKNGMQVISIYRTNRWHEKIDKEPMEDHIRIADDNGDPRFLR